MAIHTSPEPGQTRPATTDRFEVNAIALRAARRILDAADGLKSIDLRVEDRPIHVELARISAPALPAAGLPGIDPERDGQLPSGVRAVASWQNGSASLDLRLNWWRSGQYKVLIGLGVNVGGRPQTILWTTLALVLAGATEAAVSIPASIAPFRRRGESAYDAESRASSIYEVARRSGLPMSSEWYIEWFRIGVASGTVEPSPEEALRRTHHIALLKLPYFVRGEQKGIEGSPPFEIRPAVERHGPVRDSSEVEILGEPSAPRNGKRDGLYPLPGGVREYKKTLDALVAESAREALTTDQFYQYLREHYEVTGTTARASYRNLLVQLRLVALGEDVLEATDEGRAYLERRDPLDLFDRLHAVYNGILDVLVVARVLGRADSDRLSELLQGLMGTTWESDNQVNFRRNWMLSLGMTDRTQDGDALTELGQTALTRHGEETTAVQDRLTALLESAGPRPTETADTVAGDTEVKPGFDDGVPIATSAPSAWYSDRLDLDVDRLSPHLGTLAFPRLVLDRVVAALGSGKHLLLVGSPGTGKTELARALCVAATSEGYCSGAFFATASADWTTFDTIGGYALHKDHSLRFRSGALLRAIENWQWLVIDELNRADVDRAFGELMTVLAGGRTVAPYELEDGRYVSIGPDPNATHQVPKTFRVIATMNTWDKTSLFRLSYAVQRRFAVVHIGPPDDEGYAALIERHAAREGSDAVLDPSAVARLTALFSTRGLMLHRPIGAAVALDMVRYMRRRDAGGDALAEALSMFLLPQIEGLDRAPAVETFGAIKRAVDGLASQGQCTELLQRFRDLLPHVKIPSG